MDGHEHWNPLAKTVFKLFTDFWTKYPPDDQWRMVLEGTDPAMRRYRHILSFVPANPRCKFCNAPFRGPGATMMRMVGRGQSKLNPKFCSICLETIPPGGAEIELTMLFADIRGSTTLAEGMAPSEFGSLINRFYVAATDVLIHSDALIDRLIGDQVIGLYLPAFAGKEHGAAALAAARQLLQVTGHGDPAGSWIPVGVGVHTGTAFVGKVGKDSVTDITVLGDAANVAARLSSQARAGEILFSEATRIGAGWPAEGLEPRRLELKGRSESLDAWAMKG
jgi:adenylate cyclase